MLTDLELSDMIYTRFGRVDPDTRREMVKVLRDVERITAAECFELAAGEADHWQRITDKAGRCKCGTYIAAAIRAVGGATYEAATAPPTDPTAYVPARGCTCNTTSGPAHCPVHA